MDMMDGRLVAQALNYHGQQLQKVWEGDRDESELAMLNLKEPCFEIYQQRQKTLSFADRGRRLKLQQFIAKKAEALYDKSNLDKTFEPIQQEAGDEEFYATMPGLDAFVTMEKSQRIRNFLESLVVGDIIYAQVMGKSAAGLLLKVLCNCSDCPRVVADLGVKALILNTATVPAVDKKGVTRGYMANDLVCVVVSEVNVEVERVVAVMNVQAREGQGPHPPMGLIHSDDLPEAYKKALENKGQSYETILTNSTGFNNPNNIKYLCDLMGLGRNNYSNMVGLRERFPQNEYASELRQAQASKWAFRSVADGIDHFKAGRPSEAFQCLNKALTVDPKNVEGLVARGALYANSGSFKKAIEDFETALKINPTHANARKYMAETLVALGRSYEDEKKYEEAQKAYENCLAIAPYHEEARSSIEYIKSKTASGMINPMENFKNFDPEPEVLEAKKDKKKRKKERKSRSKKRQRWSSSSSSSSSGSSSSSSSESSSSSSSGSSGRSASRSPGRKRKHKKDHRGSLSPLSKRMAQYNNPPAASSTAQDPLGPVSYSGNSREKTDDYETKVRKFLEQTKDDSDYEDKVRKFLEETARWKREREREKEKKHSETEKMKKKKKKEKKGKDKEEKKNRRKKKKEERKKRKNKDKLERDLEALKKSSLPDLEQLQSKLSAYYAKVEKETAVLKRYVDLYNDVTSPLSNVEKLADSSGRDDELYREEKPYHESRSISSQRKENQRKPLNDVFDHDSDLLHSEPKVPSLDTAALNAKWKAAQAARQKDNHSGKWQELETEKKIHGHGNSEEHGGLEMEEKLQRAAVEKSMNVRKQMQRDLLSDKRPSIQQSLSSSSTATAAATGKEASLSKQQGPVKYPTPQPQNKFGPTMSQGMGKFGPSVSKFQPIGQGGSAHPPEPPPGPRASSKGRRRTSKGPRTDSESENETRNRQGRKRDSRPAGGPKRNASRDRPKRSSRSRSWTGSSSGSSRSRSHPRRSRSKSYSNRRSGSYDRKYTRSPSGTYSRSRSRSRSRSYSRSRSRSRSGDRGYYRKRQFRPYNNRGTYYKPRFQGFNNQNHRGGGGGNFQNRNRFYNNQQQHNNNNRFGNRRGFNNRGGGGGGGNQRGRGNNRGGRFFMNKSGFRDYRDRRDFRDRRANSRDRYSDRSYSPDPMRKVDEAKEKINKMIEADDARNPNETPNPPPPAPNKRQDGPLSEGEERDDDDYERWGPAEPASKAA